MGKLEQMKAMRKDGDLKRLLEKASKILDNPIAMFDTNYHLIANTDVETDDPIWNELVSTGTFCLETQMFFADIYFTYDVSNIEKVVVLKSEYLKHDRVLVPVNNRNGVMVASLVMVACNTPIAEDDIISFCAFADKITNKIRNDEHYTEYGKLYHADLIVRLLDGEITDTRLYAPHIRILYDDFDVYLFMVVIGFRQSGPQEGELEHIKDLFMERYRSSKFAIYSGYILMLTSSKHHVSDDKQILGKYDEFFERYNLAAGISSGFENLYQLRKYYDEAVAALSGGVGSGSGQRVFIRS